jgi:hypothetical protein
MSKQSTRRRRARRAGARTLTVGVGVAVLVAIVGAGSALAAVAPPDERVLERQGRVNHELSAGQASEQPKAEEPSQGSPAETRPRYIRPEPKMGPPPQLDGDQQFAPEPAPEAPDRGRGGLVAAVVVAAFLLLALGGAATWRIRQRRPQPESSRPQPESTA